jgi:zinc protease
VGRLLWPEGHPYRRDRRAEDFAVSAAAVRAAWEDLLETARPSLVAVGDLGGTAILPALEHAYGWLGHADAEGVPLTPPATGEDRVVVVEALAATQACITVAWAGPRAADGDVYAYALVFRALAQGFASRLNLRLREGEGLTYGVDGTYTDAPTYGLSQVELRVDAARAVEALAGVRAELDKIATGGLEPRELEAARRGLWVEAAGDAGTLAGLAAELGTEQLLDLAPGESARRRARAVTVSLAQANEAATRWIGGPRLWVVSGDRDTLEQALDDTGWRIDTLMSACQAVYGGTCP